MAHKKQAGSASELAPVRRHHPALVSHRHTLAVAYWFGLVGTVAFACTYGWHSWVRYQEDRHARLALVATMIAHATHEFLDDQRARMAFLAAQLRQQSAVHRARAARSLFGRYLHASPAIQSVGLLTPAGRLVAAAPVASRLLQDLQKSPRMQTDLRRSARVPGLSIDRPLYDPQTKDWVVPVTYTASRSGGGPQFMIVEVLGFRDFNRILPRSLLIPGLAIGLLRNDFYLEARTPIPLGNLQALVARAQTGVLARTLAMDQGRVRGSFDGFVSADKEYRFGAYQRVRRYPLTAFADIPRRQELFTWWHRLVEIPFFFLLAALLFSALAYYRIQLLTRRWEEEKERQKTILRSLVVHDPLTGLLNRSSLMPVLKRAMERARRYRRLLAIGFLDVNDFKLINDLYGHPAGDTILKELAVRLKRTMRGTDRIVRLGGDEFVLVIEGLQTPDDLRPVIEHIRTVLADPFIVGELALQVYVSLGLTVYPLDDEDAEGLLRHADQSMYAAKANRADGWVRIYEPRGAGGGGASPLPAHED